MKKQALLAIPRLMVMPVMAATGVSNVKADEIVTTDAIAGTLYRVHQTSQFIASGCLRQLPHVGN